MRAHNRFFSMNKLPLLFMLLGLLMLVVIYPAFNGKHVTIPTSDFPVYKSSNQNAANGWVTMEVVAAEELGTGKTTTTNSKILMSPGNKYYFLYLVKDREGNIAVYSDQESFDISHQNPFGDSNEKCPKTIYGKVSTFESKFKSFDGYDKLKQFAGYDVISEYQYPAETSHYVQSDTGRSIQSILPYVGTACFAAAVISYIVLKKQAKKTTERLRAEELKKENEKYGI